jgi:hypothetical protein
MILHSLGMRPGRGERDDHERERAAWHEAAHVLVAHGLGLRVIRAVVLPTMNDEDTNGWVEVDDTPDTWQGDHADATCALAGEIAESQFSGVPLPELGWTRFTYAYADCKDAWALCTAVASSGGSPYATGQDAYAAARETARRMLEERRGPHHALAGVLKEVGTLAESQVDVVLEVLLNGRSYLFPEDAYWATQQAVQAMRSAGA